MKTVWVNRFNADGTFKPMSEWVQACVRSETTHIMFEDDRIFQGTRSDTFTSNGRSGIHEYIGDQRGDGWFYVEDGDLPPHSYSENILAHTSTGEYAIIVSWLYNSRTVEVIYGKPICWQPIQQPKFIGECDV